MPIQHQRIALAALILSALPSVSTADNGNVTVYGVANLSCELVNMGTGTAGTPAVTGASNVSKISSNASRLGLKGVEDLGGGWSALCLVVRHQTHLLIQLSEDHMPYVNIHIAGQLLDEE